MAYFVVAEAITNMSKHSAASKAAVIISYADGALRVLVEDDGLGGASPIPAAAWRAWPPGSPRSTARSR